MDSKALPDWPTPSRPHPRPLAGRGTLTLCLRFTLTLTLTPLGRLGLRLHPRRLCRCELSGLGRWVLGRWGLGRWRW